MKSSPRPSKRPTSSTSSADAQPLCNILVAYPYWTSTYERGFRAENTVRLLIDSGAFTAFKTGKVIKLDDYCRFLETLPVKPWRYFTLDVIGDAAGTLRNYETMRKRGFNPVPIFTRGEDPRVLDDYYKTSDVVGIGGLVGTNSKGFINGIMKRAAGRRVHLLGVTHMDFLKVYRPYMCDSSSWESGARFGAIKVYMGRGQHVNIKRAAAAKPLDPDVAERIKQLGFDPYLLRKEQSWRGGDSVARLLCVASAIALSLDIQKHLGTLLFNAVSQTSAPGRFMKVMHELAGRKACAAS